MVSTTSHETNSQASNSPLHPRASGRGILYRVALAAITPLFWACAVALTFYLCLPDGVPGRYEMRTIGTPAEGSPCSANLTHVRALLRFDRATGHLDKWTKDGWQRMDLVYVESVTDTPRMINDPNTEERTGP